MIQSFDEAGKYGKEFVDTGLISFAAVSKGMQAIAAEASDYTKKSFESGSSVVEKLMGAKTFDKALEIQTDYAKIAYQTFVAEATKLGELYIEVAKDAYKPFESTLAKAK